MNTTGVQNYLSNVFRPIYTYDTTTSLFTPRLELSNIDVYSGNVVSTFRADIGDSANNVYVGSNAGNPYNILRSCRDVTAVGYSAGLNISNVSNSVFVGSNSGNGCDSVTDVISIGVDSGAVAGTSNIFIGSSTGTVGARNILIGHSMSPINISNQVRIGYSNQIPIAADISKNWVGLGGPMSPVNENNKVDISGNTRIQGNLGINVEPGDRTLDLRGNFRVIDVSNNILDFESDGFTRSSGGFGSIRGSTIVSNAANISISSLRNGVAIIAVASGDTHFDGRTVFVLNSATPIVSNISSNKSVTTTVNFTANNINISNTTGGPLTYRWIITYFPLP